MQYMTVIYKIELISELINEFFIFEKFNLH